VILLGIDPGSLKTGFGVLRVQGMEVMALDFGVIRPKGGGAFEERLLAIHDGMLRVCETHRPSLAVVEGTFYGAQARNFRSTLKLAHARGVCLLAAARVGAEVVEIAPADVKKSIVGHGRALKEQVQRMVQVLLHIPGRIPEDAADALAMALAMSHRVGSPWGATGGRR